MVGFVLARAAWLDPLLPWLGAALALAAARLLARRDPARPSRSTADGFAERVVHGWRGRRLLGEAPEPAPSDATGVRAASRFVRCALLVWVAAATASAWSAALQLVADGGEHGFGSAARAAHALVLIAALALEIRVAWVLLSESALARSFGLAPLRAGVVAFVLALACNIEWLRPYDSLRASLSLAYACGACALATLLGPAFLARAPARAARSLDFVVFNLCLAVVVGELVLRVYARSTTSEIFSPEDVTEHEWLQRARFQPGTLHHAFPANRHGYYDTNAALEPGPGPLVACIGDSFSASLVPHRFHFTTVAERELGLEIYNVGAAGAGPPQYAHLLQTEVLPLRPELVVIDLFVGNDLVFPAPCSSARPPLQSAVDPHKFQAWRSAKRVWAFLRERDALQQELGQFGHTPPAVREPIDSGEGLVALEPWLADWRLERATHSKDTFLELERTRALDACAGGRERLADLFAQLERMCELVSDARLAVMLIPDEFQLEDELWDEIVHAEPGVELERDGAQREIAAWLAARGVACLDLLPILRAEPREADGRYHLFHVQDTHFNARGNAVVGRALAAFVRGEIGPAPSSAGGAR